MQMYPSGGCAQPYYTAVDNEDDGFYYDNGFPHQSMQMRPDQAMPPPKQNHMWDNLGKDDYLYKNSSSMQMRNDQSIPSPKQNYMLDNFGKDDYQDNNGSSMKNQWNPPQKHNYNHMNGYRGYDHGYGGYDHGYDNFKNGREDYNVQYTEGWDEKERDYDTWNSRNDYGKHQNGNKYLGKMSLDLEMSGGYGPYQGPYIPMAKPRPYYSEQIKGPPPVWCNKGMVD